MGLIALSPFKPEQPLTASILALINQLKFFNELYRSPSLGIGILLHSQSQENAQAPIALVVLDPPTSAQLGKPNAAKPELPVLTQGLLLSV